MLELVEPLFTLACFRQYAISRFWDLLYADDLDQLAIDENELVLDGICLLAESIGISTVRSDWIDPIPENLEKIFTHGFDAALQGSILTQIEDAFGSQLTNIFQIGQLICALHSATSWLVPEITSGSLNSARQIVREEADEIISNIGQLGQALKILLDPIAHILDSKLYDIFRKIIEQCSQGDCTSYSLARILNSTTIAIEKMLPHCVESFNRLQRAKALLCELNTISPGYSNWRAYEHWCLKVCRFCFVPPFRHVLEQVASDDGHERRDAVIPNIARFGFWRDVREDFGCRYIVLEFKNGAEPLDKNGLNQLRTYLAKPFIGRFGITFCRTSPSQSWCMAQRDSIFHDSRLILAFDDQGVRELLLARVFLGSPAFVIERAKIALELSL